MWKIISDHNPILYIQKSTLHSVKLQQRLMVLKRHNIHILHCPGAQLKSAEGLSRLVPE